MAVTPTLMRDSQFDGERDTLSEQTLHRTYNIGNAGTLADVSLNRGDALPEDATAEIVESWIDTGKNGRVARVIARKPYYETGGG